MAWLNIVSFVAAGACILAIGVRGLVQKKPFMTSARVIMWSLFVCFIPVLVYTVTPLLNPKEMNGGENPYWLVFRNGFMVFLFVSVIWGQYQGYMAFGITKKMLCEAIEHTLSQQKIEYKESPYVYRLTDIGADLVVVSAGWFGIAQIHVVQKQHRPVLNQIAGSMQEYFKRPSSQANYDSFVIYTIIGIATIIIALVFSIQNASGF